MMRYVQRKAKLFERSVMSFPVATVLLSQTQAAAE